MAIAGGGMPSMQVRIHRGHLEAVGMTVNVPESKVQTDMVMAAEAIRHNPGISIRIDAKRFVDLQHYLRNSGHVE